MQLVLEIFDCSTRFQIKLKDVILDFGLFSCINCFWIYSHFQARKFLDKLTEWEKWCSPGLLFVSLPSGSERHFSSDPLAPSSSWFLLSKKLNVLIMPALAWRLENDLWFAPRLTANTNYGADSLFSGILQRFVDFSMFTWWFSEYSALIFSGGVSVHTVNINRLCYVQCFHIIHKQECKCKNMLMS